MTLVLCIQKTFVIYIYIYIIQSFAIWDITNHQYQPFGFISQCAKIWMANKPQWAHYDQRYLIGRHDSGTPSKHEMRSRKPCFGVDNLIGVSNSSQSFGCTLLFNYEQLWICGLFSSAIPTILCKCTASSSESDIHQEILISIKTNDPVLDIATLVYIDFTNGFVSILVIQLTLFTTINHYVISHQTII